MQQQWDGLLCRGRFLFLRSARTRINSGVGDAGQAGTPTAAAPT